MQMIIAEDTLLVREGLRRVLTELGHEVVAVATHADEVLDLVALYRPAMVLLDIRLPPTFTDEGLKIAATVQDQHPDTRVLVLSQYVEPGYAASLLEQAVPAGYLLKETICETAVLNDALRRLAAGETVIEPRLVRDLTRRPRADDVLGVLTPRELDVLTLMAEGLSDQGIAGRLHLSPATVSTHTQSVFRKLAIPATCTDNRRVGAVLTFLRCC